MINKINNKNYNQTEKIYHVFQDSYAIEAKILKAADFPPLKRTISEFIDSDTLFLGYTKGQDLAAVIELDIDKQSIHIQSLVVDPQFFRLGIAGKLIDFVFNNFETKYFTVETGLDNLPAISLYKKYGFVESKQYDTNHGIRKIRLMKL